MLFRKSMSSRLPVLFLSHGAGPMPLLRMESSTHKFSSVDETSRSAAFMKTLSSYVTKTFRNILVLSAHWEESEFTVDYQPNETKLVYDYYNFPKEAYAPYLTYPAQTDLHLADRIHQLLTQAGVTCEKKDRGFDHGVYIPLKAAYPEANIPIVELSLKNNLNIEEHIQLGELLAPLRDEGTLIVCSGQITHNLHETNNGLEKDPRTVAFTEWIKHLLENITQDSYAESKAKLINIRTLCPNYDWAHPRTEHFVPLYVAFGAFKTNTSPSTCDVNEVESSGIHRIYDDIVLDSMGIDHYIVVVGCWVECIIF